MMNILLEFLAYLMATPMEKKLMGDLRLIRDIYKLSLVVCDWQIL